MPIWLESSFRTAERKVEEAGWEFRKASVPRTQRSWNINPKKPENILLLCKRPDTDNVWRIYLYRRGWRKLRFVENVVNDGSGFPIPDQAEMLFDDYVETWPDLGEYHKRRKSREEQRKALPCQ
jgi:hypothetical protein